MFVSLIFLTFKNLQSLLQSLDASIILIKGILLILTSALVIRYFSHSSNFWKSKGIVQFKPPSIIREFFELVKKPVHELELERYKKYGPLYGYFEGSTPVLTVGDPKLLQKILVKDFDYFTDTWSFDTGDEVTETTIEMLRGEQWKKVRSAFAPSFTSLKVKKMTEKVKYCVDQCIASFDAIAGSGQPVDLKKFYNAYTMDVITNTAFSLKTDSQENPSNPFIRNAMNLSEQGINWRFILYMLFPRLCKIMKIPIYEPTAIKFFANVMQEIVNERRKSSVKPDDFLQFMMDKSVELAVKPEQRRRSLTNKEIVSQCVFSFIAGFETTAITLSFATYFLAINPEVQEILIKEIDDTIDSCGGNITYEVIQEMDYLDKVLSETLRLCPPTVRLDRVAVKDYRFEDTGLTIPKGTIIIVPIIAIQRDAKFFPDPEKFDPERFSPEEKSKMDPFTYMPFGAGPRQCLGAKLALFEAKMCLIHVLSQFRVKKCPQAKEHLEYNNGIGFLHPKEIIVNVEKRTDRDVTCLKNL